MIRKATSNKRVRRSIALSIESPCIILFLPEVAICGSADDGAWISTLSADRTARSYRVAFRLIPVFSHINFERYIILRSVIFSIQLNSLPVLVGGRRRDQAIGLDSLNVAVFAVNLSPFHHFCFYIFT
jgi:hypothetical protein